MPHDALGRSAERHGPVSQWSGGGASTALLRDMQIAPARPNASLVRSRTQCLAQAPDGGGTPACRRHPPSSGSAPHRITPPPRHVDCHACRDHRHQSCTLHIPQHGQSLLVSCFGGLELTDTSAGLLACCDAGRTSAADRHRTTAGRWPAAKRGLHLTEVAWGA